MTHTCKCCGHELNVAVQEWDARLHREPTIMVTCENPECDLYAATLSLQAHAEVNVEEYAEAARRYRAGQ